MDNNQNNRMNLAITLSEKAKAMVKEAYVAVRLAKEVADQINPLAALARKKDRKAFDKAWEETVIKPLKEKGLLKEENSDNKRN